MAARQPRRPTRPALFKALASLSTQFELRVVTESPFVFAVDGQTDFEFFRQPLPFRTFRERAHAAVTTAIVALAERPRRRPIGGSGPASLRLTKRAIVGRVREAIERGGFDAVVGLTFGQTPPPAPDSLAWEGAEGRSSGSAKALLGGVSPDRSPPSDREMQKAVRYVFGQGWHVVVKSKTPPRLDLRRCFRFAPHVDGKHLSTPDEVARTVVFRAIEQAVQRRFTKLEAALWARLLLAETSEDEAAALVDYRATLCGEMVTAVDNTGFAGLVGCLAETGLASSGNEEAIRWAP